MMDPGISKQHILLYAIFHVFMRVIVRRTDGGVKDSEGSDHILTAVPADAASYYWNLAGDLKLFTHFPSNPPALVERVCACMCVHVCACVCVCVCE